MFGWLQHTNEDRRGRLVHYAVVVWGALMAFKADANVVAHAYEKRPVLAVIEEREQRILSAADRLFPQRSKDEVRAAFWRHAGHADEVQLARCLVDELEGKRDERRHPVEVG